MNERSENTGMVVAVGIALMLMLLLVLGGGLGFFVFIRQARVAQAQAEMARAAEVQARRSVAEAETAQMLLAAKQALAPQKSDDAINSSADPSSIKPAIEAVLLQQQEAWNAGNIDQFMDHYWKSDELTFSSGGQITRGWNSTLQRYRERYPTQEMMGKLKFDELEVMPLGGAAALVLGRWNLERETEPLTGNFSLVVRKIEDRWFIIHDHTSRLAD